MKKYNSEFKSMIVELYKTRRSVKDFSREYRGSKVTIHTLELYDSLSGTYY